jgi:hypothetical protein
MFPLFSFIGEFKMAILNSIMVNGIKYDLPGSSAQQFSSQLQDLGHAM